MLASRLRKGLRKGRLLREIISDDLEIVGKPGAQRAVAMAIVMLVAAQMAVRGEPLSKLVVQDFEEGSSAPKVWVVNIPNENASVELSSEQAASGKQSLKLHYHFTGDGQYLGIPLQVNILDLTGLAFQVFGDASGSTLGVEMLDGSGETHKYNLGTVDFRGWKEIAFPADAGHETWAGDQNGRIDFPVKGIVLIVGTPRRDLESDLYFDAVSVSTDKTVAEALGLQIAVASPAYGADIRGNTPVKVVAPGLKSVTVKCWQGGSGFERDSVVGEFPLNAEGRGSFVFPADQYPRGPITVRISGKVGAVSDTCHLQLYNSGGISWKEGMPESPPPAAKGMKLVFADDFNGPLSIGEAPTDTYYDHKPPRGHQDFSSIPFTSHSAPNTPFAQKGGYLRIRASEKVGSAGLISSIKPDGSGVKASAPCYFECRFIGPNAIGSWPAFWLMTDYMTDYSILGDKTPVDELDIIEAYGGEGPGRPNADDKYMIAPHRWNQGDEATAMADAAYASLNNPIQMRKFGIPSTWFEAFHVYACKITETDTIYYCDDVEVARHATFPVSKAKPHFFMVNLATGGGWPVDLSRYDGRADMYVDYIRVYQGGSSKDTTGGGK
jgi:hypothetical protein